MRTYIFCPIWTLSSGLITLESLRLLILMNPWTPLSSRTFTPIHLPGHFSASKWFQTCQKGQYNSFVIIVQGVPKKMSHSWEPKKLGTLYSETKHLSDLKLWQQRALMSTPCSHSLRPNRLVASKYEAPNLLGSQEWDTFFGTPCTVPPENPSSCFWLPVDVSEKSF